MLSSTLGAGSSIPITQPEGHVSIGQEYRFMSREETGQTQQWKQEGQVEQKDKDEAHEEDSTAEKKSKPGLLKGSIGIMGNAVLHPINTTTSITKKLVQPLTDFVAGIEEIGLPAFRRPEETTPSGTADENQPTSPAGPAKPALTGIEEEQQILMQEERERDRLRRARGQAPWTELETTELKRTEAASPAKPTGIRREKYIIEPDQTEHREIIDEQPKQQPKQEPGETLTKEQLRLDFERRIMAQKLIIEQLERNAKELMTEQELHANMLAEAERHRQNAEQATQLLHIEVNDKLQQRDKSRREELEYEKLRLAAYTRAVELENQRVRALAQLKLTEKKLDHFRELCSHHDTGIKRAEALLRKNMMEKEAAQHQLQRLQFEKESIQFIHAAPPGPLITKPLELSVTVKPQVLLDCRLKPKVQQTDVHATALITEEISTEERAVGEDLASRALQGAAKAETKQFSAHETHFRESEKQKQATVGGESRHMEQKDTAPSSTKADAEEKAFSFGLIRKQIDISEGTT